MPSFGRRPLKRTERALSAGRLAACAVMCALLLVVQYVLSFVPGVELVTALLLAFCYFFGCACGMLTATAFSLLRCFLFGFEPGVLLLYLLYFNAFALLFGHLGKRAVAAWICPALLLALMGGALAVALVHFPVSVLMISRLRILSWALFGVLAALLCADIVLLACRRDALTVSLAALAAFMSVCFTLLDDVITPLLYGRTWEFAFSYFCTGFLAMLPQTVCAAVSVFFLFPVLARIFRSVRKTPPQTLDE